RGVVPHLIGRGGDGPIGVHDAGTGTQHVICGLGVAPAAATVGHVRALGHDMVPGTGLLAATVPGAFDAWATLLLRHGTWRLPDVLSFAIGYADRGAHMVPRVVRTLDGVRPLFEREWPTSAALWLRDGGPRPGGLWRNPLLAETWARLLRDAARPGRDAEIEAARDAWYRGFIAEAIGRFVATTEAMDTSGRRSRGVLTANDMAAWRAPVEPPLARRYRGVEVLKCGPWSQGPAALQLLAILEGFDLAAMDPCGAEYVHTVTEAMKLAFADREAFYGDPAMVQVPMEALLSDGYAAARRALIGHGASQEQRPGEVPGSTARPPDYPAAIARAAEAAVAGA
ncbi:MAG: gamma-glutamyltransferase, partial [Acetobacteraceae bacterium]